MCPLLQWNTLSKFCNLLGFSWTQCIWRQEGLRFYHRHFQLHTHLMVVQLAHEVCHPISNYGLDSKLEESGWQAAKAVSHPSSWVDCWLQSICSWMQAIDLMDEMLLVWLENSIELLEVASTPPLLEWATELYGSRTLLEFQILELELRCKYHKRLKWKICSLWVINTGHLDCVYYQTYNDVYDLWHSPISL